MEPLIRHRWRAPAHVHAVTTTRAGGASTGAYQSFNLGDHVGDDTQAVRENRGRLRALLGVDEPVWLKQVHGTAVANAAEAAPGAVADGGWTERRGVVCAILTADCLPVFLSDRAGTRVALLHAGWRGLAAGIISAGVSALARDATELVAHLGPAIGPESYEVGDEVRAAFVTYGSETQRAFRASRTGHYWMDLYQLARIQLRELGVAEVSGGECCTLRQRETYYSHRRDGVSGRMASLIWIE
jgi:polyphenol oxidase